MNKKLDIRKNAIILFIINIIALISMVFFNIYYSMKGFSSFLINAIFVVDIVFLLTGIVFNVLFIKDSNKYDKSLVSKVIIILFIFYLVINTAFMFFINKSLGSRYTKINEQLSSYCEKFGCDKYDTVTGNGYEKFVVDKTYFDYDKVENDLKITIKYDTKDIISVEAVMYSRKEMFSETIIYDELKEYFKNFGYDMKEEKVKEAFDNRITSSVKDGKATYKVTEVYKNEELQKLKTIITLDLKQE